MLLFSDASTLVDDIYLSRALVLAQRGRVTSAPNPVVGCVVVAGGRIVGEGFHPRAGQPHAEVFALADAGSRARGADVYVTLEPCAHHGRTPPCADALITAGVRSVTIGLRDPSEEAGGGAERLRAAGVEVRMAQDPTPFALVNAGWLKRLATQMPRVIVKVGVSLDGSPALQEGERASMTGPSGREVTRRLRSSVDAVMVGAATVRADDPALTIRDSAGRPGRDQPLRVVLARDTLPAPDAQVFVDGLGPSAVLVPESRADVASKELGGRAAVIPYDETFGIVGALRALGAHGVNDVLVEAGPRLLAALIADDAVDAIVVVSGGGFAGPSAPRMIAAHTVEPTMQAVRDPGVESPVRPEKASPRASEALDRRFAAREAGVIGDVAVTVWERSSVYADVCGEEGPACSLG